jgi:hypothetical protein
MKITLGNLMVGVKGFVPFRRYPTGCASSLQNPGKAPKFPPVVRQARLYPIRACAVAGVGGGGDAGSGLGGAQPQGGRFQLLGDGPQRRVPPRTPQLFPIRQPVQQQSRTAQVLAHGGGAGARLAIGYGHGERNGHRSACVCLRTPLRSYCAPNRHRRELP